MPHQRATLAPWDYVVISLTMLLSVFIGVYFRLTTKKKTPGEFLMAGRSMGRLPVVFSLVVTKLSAIAITGEASDIYLYGTQRCVSLIFIFVGCFATAYVFLPVYFAVGTPTIYEFLERRFGRKIRRLMSVVCYLHTLLNMSVVIYIPAIAISAVTTFSTDTSFLLIGGVCIIFSAMGGLKAVMWADVFQAVIMCSGLFAILIQGIYAIGGVSKLYQAAYEGDRMEIFNFAGDKRTPYSLWNSLSYGFQYGMAHTVNQFEVQRLLAIRNLEDAKSAAMWSSIPSFIMGALITTCGLVLFAVFKNCDPLSAESGSGLTKPDQILPYYIVTQLQHYPGLAGLCISGILCASTSTLSSALNSLSTVFVEDFLNPCLQTPQRISKFRMYIIAKSLVVIHGTIIIGLTYLTSLFTNVLQCVVVLDGMILGPTLAIYLLGMLSERTNETGALIGLCVGGGFSAWFGLGSSLFAEVYPGKHVSTGGCARLNSTDCCPASFRNTTTIPSKMEKIFPLHSVSYMWTYCIGVVLTVSISYLASCIINVYKKPAYIDPHLLCPIIKQRFPEDHTTEQEFCLETQRSLPASS